jgi:hypothetical protein
VSATYRGERGRALALLLEAQGIIEALIERPDHIPGNPPEGALWYLPDAIGMLTPDDEDTTSNGRPMTMIVDNDADESRRQP